VADLKHILIATIHIRLNQIKKLILKKPKTLKKILILNKVLLVFTRKFWTE
jgi:hypothetical protein